MLAASSVRALIASSKVTLTSTALVLVEMTGLVGAACASEARPANPARLVMTQRSTTLFRSLAGVSETGAELADEFFRGIGDHCSGWEDRLRACLVECIVVLRWHYAANDDHDVVASVL